MGKMIVIQRIIAMPNDVLKCVDGRFFVNDIDVDDALTLRYSYKLSTKDFNTFIKNDFIDDESFVNYPISADSIVTFLDEDYVKNLSLNLKRHMLSETLSLAKDLSSKSHNWTINNFGPITIPEGNYFFVGDNRDNSLDSRYNGLVDEKDIKGALLFQF